MTLSVATAATLFSATAAFACACCAEPGQRTQTTERFGEYVSEILVELPFGEEATTFTTACGEECVQGVAVIADSYKVAAKWTNGSLTLDLTGPTPEASGVLKLARASSVMIFATDPTPGSQEGGTTLYKEWRLKTQVAGTGTFDAVRMGRASATLVIHGAGNNCPSPEDMTHWSLDVKGIKIDFRLFGKIGWN